MAAPTSPTRANGSFHNNRYFTKTVDHTTSTSTLKKHQQSWKAFKYNTHRTYEVSMTNLAHPTSSLFITNKHL
jgi:hypothetical protein